MHKVNGINVFGKSDKKTMREMITAASQAAGAALMADNHYSGHGCSVGSVLLHVDQVSPTEIGVDIGCGNKWVRTDIRYEDLRQDLPAIMDTLQHKLVFGAGGVNKVNVDHPLFDDPAWTLPYLAALKDKAQDQLGTIGGGNHYVDLFVDSAGWVDVGVHFGSRGFGNLISRWVAETAGYRGGEGVPPLLLDVDSALGTDYLEGMYLAGQYAYAGRDWVVGRVCDILGAGQTDEIHNHHNYAWYEHHQGQNVWVIRKGATPAFPGQRGFIGGTMGTHAYLIEGTDSPLSELTFNSTVHGAGRVMSRVAATGKSKYNKATGERTFSPGRVTWEDFNQQTLAVEVRGGGLDEAPMCYKNIDDVIAAQGDTIRVLDILTPIGAIMAGAGVPNDDAG